MSGIKGIAKPGQTSQLKGYNSNSSDRKRSEHPDVTYWREQFRVGGAPLTPFEYRYLKMVLLSKPITNREQMAKEVFG